MKEVIRIEYPKNEALKKYWNKQYGTNAYWAGKHHTQRAQDAKYWHSLVWAAMTKARCRKKPFDKPVVVTFRWNDRLDLDNHTMMGKMILDGIKQRLIHDDSRRWVKGIEHYWHQKPYIEITLQEVETDDGQ